MQSTWGTIGYSDQNNISTCFKMQIKERIPGGAEACLPLK